MTKKLFVGGLSWGTGDEQFKAAFEKFGTVAEAKVILDQETGRSRGFGFVTFDDDAAATTAVSQMDGADLDGRTIRVNEAQERARPPRDGGGGPRGGGGGGPRGGSGGAGRPGGFRSEDRPPARGGKPRRGGKGGDDRFARKRNANETRNKGRGGGGGGGPGGGPGGGGYDDYE